MTGVIVGSLMWATANISWYGLMDVACLASTIVNPVADAVVTGPAGAIICLDIRRMEPAL